MKNHHGIRIHKYKICHCIGIMVIIALVLASISCVGIGEAEGSPEEGRRRSADEDPGAKGEDTRKDPSSSFHNSYSEKDLLKALIQYNHLAMYGDYFSSYVNTGNPAFEEFLLFYFGIESGTYKPGEGTVFTAYDNSGEVRERITRIFLGTASKDSRTAERSKEGWWRIEQERGDERFVYEVLVDAFSAPREVRFVLPMFGQVYCRKTLFGISIEEAPESRSDAEIAAVLEEERENKLRENTDRLGLDVENVTKGFIEIGGEQVYSVRFSGTVNNGAIPVEIWFSPDLPGRLLRMRGKGQLMFEVTKVLDDRKMKFPDEVTEPFPED